MESYLNMEKMIAAAIQSRSDAIHPGWGFLAENHVFAQMVIDAGLLWIGPKPKVIEALGDKIQAKSLANKANVPTIPGIIDVANVDQITKWMKHDRVSFPIMIKAVAGGGGRGMVKVEHKNQLVQALVQCGRPFELHHCDPSRSLRQ